MISNDEKQLMELLEEATSDSERPAPPAVISRLAKEARSATPETALRMARWLSTRLESQTIPVLLKTLRLIDRLVATVTTTAATASHLSHSSNNHTLSLSYSSDWLMRMLILSVSLQANVEWIAFVKKICLPGLGVAARFSKPDPRHGDKPAQLIREGGARCQNGTTYIISIR